MKLSFRPDIPPLYRRQFIIRTASEGNIPDGWTTERIGSAVLAYCTDLPVRSYITRDSKTCWLVGRAFQADPAKPTVDQELQNNTADKIPALTHSFAGRWALICDGLVLTDASGLFGVYHTMVNGELLVAGSPSVLRGHEPKLTLTKMPLATYGMSWLPTPSSALNGVHKLLPDQTLRLSDGVVLHIERNRDLRAGGTVEKLGNDLLAALSHILVQIAEQDGQVRLAMSAGLDSRTLLVAALHADLRPELISFGLQRGSIADVTVPSMIANRLGLQHRVVRPAHFSIELERRYRQQTLGVAPDSRRFVSHNMIRSARRGEHLIFGHCFEVGRNYYWKSFHDLEWDQVVNEPSSIPKRLRHWGSATQLGRLLRPWIDWRSLHPAKMSWQDAFYRDQRIGAWLSSVQIAQDLSDGEFLQPANSQYIYDILLRAEPGSRRSGAVQRSLLETSDSPLHAIPINPSERANLRSRTVRYRRRLGRAAYEGRLWASELRSR